MSKTGGYKRKRKTTKKQSKISYYIGFAAIALVTAISIAEAVGFDIEGKLGLTKKKTADCDDVLEVHYIDVGQGDCILIECDGHNMLIDCGEASESETVLNYLKTENITELDCVVATHPHSDHMGAMSSVVDNMQIESFIMPYLPDEDVPTTRFFENFLNSADAAELDITEAKSGMKIELGEAVATVIAPAESCSGANDYSVGIVLDHGANTFVFTGDAEKAGETNMIESGLLKDCDVYKAGHHGSSTSSSEQFLDIIKPEYTVISCGAGNSYGHPNDAAIERITEYTSQDNIYRTDLSGTIVFVSDGNEININTEK